MGSNPALVCIEELPHGVIVVRLHGEHDLSTLPQVRDALLAAESVVVDLTEASFIDSSIVGVLIMASSQRMLVIVSTSGTHPRRILDMVGAGDLLPMVDSRAAALAVYGVDDPPELDG